MGEQRIKVGGIDDPIWREPLAPDAPKPRRALVTVAAGLLLLPVIVTISSASVLSRRDYGTFSFWGLPRRIDYCHRRYYREGTVHGTHQSLIGRASWRTVEHTFVWRPIDAAILPNAAMTDVCSMT